MNWMKQKLKPHIGHKVVCVAYGHLEDPVDVCIECEDCGCVLVSAEDFEIDDGALAEGLGAGAEATPRLDSPEEGHTE